jgi:hypothetical protein
LRWRPDFQYKKPANTHSTDVPSCGSQSNDEKLIMFRSFEVCLGELGNLSRITFESELILIDGITKPPTGHNTTISWHAHYNLKLFAKVC